MKVVYVAAAVLAAAIALTNAEGDGKASIFEEHPIDWYDCSHKDDGNYLHPSDCTRFISCSGGIASQRDCANCHIDARRCPTGRLVYNVTVDACLWADETECSTDDQWIPPTTWDPTHPTTADPLTTETSDTDNTDVPRPSTTERPAPTTTASPTDPGLPKPGDTCDPEACKNTGWCLNYLRCDKKSKKWVKQRCGEDLVWNPRHPNGTEHIHGGNCDFFKNLNEDIKEQYWSGTGRPEEDEKCLECFWKELGKCNQKYEYQPANGTYENIITMSCSQGLVFVEEKETCQLCSDARDDKNQPCC